MKCIQFLSVALVIVCVYSADNSILERKDFELILVNFQNKLKVITDINNFNTAQINANLQALGNIQTQVDQIVATNTATRNANDANNIKLTRFAASYGGNKGAIGQIYPLFMLGGLGAAYQSLATAVSAI